MKRIFSLPAVLLALVLVLAAAGCGGQTADQTGTQDDAPSIVGTWAYSDEESGMGAVYVLEEDGTGTYTITVGDEEVLYELKYEVEDGHLLVTYVNNETFTEDDVFDSEFQFQDPTTLIIQDSFGTEMTFVKQ
ncbi:MAG: hypothetical protein IKD79_04185 [Oscillospiraceae bacterium]|nr:hypothetical protein [Oscillospiraceae bacterium]